MVDAEYPLVVPAPVPSMTAGIIACYLMVYWVVDYQSSTHDAPSCDHVHEGSVVIVLDVHHDIDILGGFSGHRFARQSKQQNHQRIHRPVTCRRLLKASSSVIISLLQDLMMGSSPSKLRHEVDVVVLITRAQKYHIMTIRDGDRQPSSF